MSNHTVYKAILSQFTTKKTSTQAFDNTADMDDGNRSDVASDDGTDDNEEAVPEDDLQEDEEIDRDREASDELEIEGISVDVFVSVRQAAIGRNALLKVSFYSIILFSCLI